VRDTEVWFGERLEAGCFYRCFRRLESPSDQAEVNRADDRRVKPRGLAEWARPHLDLRAAGSTLDEPWCEPEQVEQPQYLRQAALGARSCVAGGSHARQCSSAASTCRDKGIRDIRAQLREGVDERAAEDAETDKFRIERRLRDSVEASGAPSCSRGCLLGHDEPSVDQDSEVPPHRVDMGSDARSEQVSIEWLR
jgi:hypothetical protein